MTAICPRAFFPASGAAVRIARAVRASAFAVTVALCAAAYSQQLSLTLDNLEAPGLVLSGVRADLHGSGAAFLEIASIRFGERTWRNVRLDCPRLRLEAARIECTDGVIDIDGRVPLAFAYDTRRKELDLTLRPESGETWRFELRERAGAGNTKLTIAGGRMERVNAWLPPAMPRVKAGRVEGTISGGGSAPWTAELTVADLQFSDASGLHAGENVGGRITGTAERKGDAWHWRAAMEWIAGEVYWQPLYLVAASQRLTAEGVTDSKQTVVVQGGVASPAIGSAAFEGVVEHAGPRIARGSASSRSLEAGALYEHVLKPFAAGTALSDLRAEGRIAADVRWENGALEGVDVRFEKVSVEDRQRRFALFGLDGHLPWHRENSLEGVLAIDGGELLRIPFGALQVPIGTRGMRLRWDAAQVPLLDGKLSMRGFAGERPAAGWNWSFSGSVEPMSMDRLTQALGWPTMHGQVSATIPRVSYDASTLKVDGSLVFKVFDGAVTVSNLTLADPFGKAPRLNANVDMRGLDLDLLTRAFSFGNITGRVDGVVQGLELVNWEPVAFQAWLLSAPGDYRRRISQNAVANITALGSAGAAAALQRTFLRFFDEFGYERLGISCRLERGVCEMGGVENAPQGYVIVKGGGLPSISVIGYNRSVHWRELLDRLKRVVQDNVKAVIR